MSAVNLFWLQPEIAAILSAAVGTSARVLTAYDLARAKGELSQAPAVYLLPDGMAPQGSKGDAVSLIQRWEVAISVPVSVSDQGGNDAMATIGELAHLIIGALRRATLPGVRQIELLQQDFNAGLVGNRLVMPFTFTASFIHNF